MSTVVFMKNHLCKPEFAVEYFDVLRSLHKKHFPSGEGSDEIGKVILQCCISGSHLFLYTVEILIDEEFKDYLFTEHDVCELVSPEESFFDYEKLCRDIISGNVKVENQESVLFNILSAGG